MSNSLQPHGLSHAKLLSPSHIHYLVLVTKLSHCLASFCTPRPNMSAISVITWLPNFQFQSAMIKCASIFGVLENFVILLIELVNFCFFDINGWSIPLDYCDVEQFVLETNWDHYDIFEVSPSTAFWTLVDYEGYFVSSKGFWPTIVDIMVV